MVKRLSRKNKTITTCQKLVQIACTISATRVFGDLSTRCAVILKYLKWPCDSCIENNMNIVFHISTFKIKSFLKVSIKLLLSEKMWIQHHHIVHEKTTSWISWYVNRPDFIISVFCSKSNVFQITFSISFDLHDIFYRLIFSKKNLSELSCHASIILLLSSTQKRINIRYEKSKETSV